MTGRHAERERQDLEWDVHPAAGWREFVACGACDLALVARAIEGYARLQAGQGEGARSQ